MIRRFSLALYSCLASAAFLCGCQTPDAGEIDDADLNVLGVSRSQIESRPELVTSIQQGIKHFRRGEFTTALEDFDECKKEDATLPTGSLMLARLGAQSNEMTVAAERLAANDSAKLVQMFEHGSNAAYEASRKATDADLRRSHLLDARSYSESLSKLKPQDPNYRFNVGYLAAELGETEKAQQIMDKLAARYATGFAKAHLWQADQLLSPERPLTPDVLDAAEMHLHRALPTHSEPDEIHRRLGELYYFRYVRYAPNAKDPQLPREIYLAKAEEHLSQVVKPDATLRLKLAEIRALSGKTQQAEVEVERLAEDLKKRLEQEPDDLETRLRLVQCYRMTKKFDEAVRVLEEGKARRPGPRYDRALSEVRYYQSLDLRQRKPTDFTGQFVLLSKAYRASPTNNYVVHRFLQALTSATAEEADAARTALAELAKTRAPGAAAEFFLGFDARRRTLSQEAQTHFDAAKTAPADATPEVLAGLVIAVNSGQVRSISTAAAQQLLESALTVWPNDPHLLKAAAVRSKASPAKP